MTDEALDKVVSNCLIYEIPVPLVALEAVCQSVPNYQKKLQQAQDKGLIEVICNDDRETLYRASHIKHINPHIELPKDASKLSALAGTAAKALTELWGNKENKNEEKWREIFRLAFADKENPERFREQFTQMIEVQCNDESDNAFEQELRQQKDYLSVEHLYDDLETYLQANDWRKADEETAWIFYKLMVIDNYKDFHKLFREVSLDVVNEIDRLWVKYSEGKFGLKIQAKLHQDIGGTEKYNDNKIWNEFVDLVGYGTSNITLKMGNFPERMYYFYGIRWGNSPYRLRGDFAIGGFMALCVSLFSRIET
ncbi:GUN4 domain-containing protein [Microcystis aeruginosa CS-563/04]|uniref:GUN4 domain-containing protein n=1 Tax=Microcystis aeruginosa TaxID=1126 RepID=UPI00232B5F62|nr:GUN4 domain-containing protein [Microcystis aeruginosa]MDB9420467.1 GUN4 domain-containing protein [Microcystis aeruginosa CS-563/04]